MIKGGKLAEPRGVKQACMVRGMEEEAAWRDAVYQVARGEGGGLEEEDSPGQTLWLGLLYDRPADAIDYLLQHIQRLRINSPGSATLSIDPLPVSDNRRTSRLPVLPAITPATDGNMASMGPPTSTGVKRKRENVEIEGERAVYRRMESGVTSVTESSVGSQAEAATSSSTITGGPHAPEAPPSDAGQTEGEEEEGDLEIDLDLPDQFWRILHGSMTDLPRMPTNTVRIFLSSTFSDFKAERNKLPLLAYPQLERWCSTRGLDFQVVDMRWGVTDDVVQDHQVSPLCIEEIKTCQQLSCGPNFMVLLGDRYGWQGFPPRIQCEEFERLLSEIRLVGEDLTKLLQTWFLEDKNAVPPEFVLQPIHAHLKHYHDTSDVEKRSADRQAWAHISAELQKTLRIGAKAARERGDFTEEQERKYFMSVTEEEIQQGVFHTSHPENHTMCYHRSLLGIDDTKDDMRRGKFIDMDEHNGVDREAASLRHGLIHQKLPSQLPDENIREYDVTWKHRPLETSTEAEHLHYLTTFCNHFVEDVKRLVDGELRRDEGGRETRDKWNVLYHEVLHHARFGNIKSEVFCGRREEIERIKTYLSSGVGGFKPPFIVHGVSGMGKTALLAHIASRFQAWFPQGYVCILRFLGTSPLSSSISDTLRSIIDQLRAVYKIPTPAQDAADMFGSVRRQFDSVLHQVAGKLTCPLVIVLDSVDQLLPQSAAHRLLWLPRALPPNIYIITSMLSSDHYNCLHHAQLRFKHPAHYLTLPPLSQFTGDTIMDSHLARVHRRLTDDQRNIVVQAFKCLRHPLYLKLVIDEAKQWVSYLPASAINILPPGTDSNWAVQAAIMKLFESMESKHGSVFVRHALGYLTCGKGGLTNIEMEDILSCDDDVLNEVYQYHEPPLEGVVRIPSLLWSRLQFALKEYISERRVDGKVVLAWYHRQFHDAAMTLYLTSDDVISCRHRALSEIFNQESGIKRTITLHQLGGKVISEADRRVKPQPLVVSNLRKLQAVPYHLYRAGDHDRLLSRCLINYTWLHLKLQALPITSVIRDYQDMDVHPSVAVFKKFLELCFDALKQDANLLAYSVVSRMEECCKDDPLIQDVITDARRWLQTTHTPLLLPTHDLQLQKIDSPLTFSLMLGYRGKLTPDEGLIVCEWNEANSGVSKIQTLDIKSRDIVASVPLDKPTPYTLCPDGRHFVFVENSEVKMHEVECGDDALHFTYTPVSFDKVIVRCLDVSQSGKYLTVSVKTGRPTNQALSKKWRGECVLYLIDLEEQKTLHSLVIKGRKLVDKVYFVLNDSCIFTSSKNKLVLYNTSDLSVKHEVASLSVEVAGDTIKLMEDGKVIVGAGRAGKMVRVFTYHTEDMRVEYSEDVHLPADDHKTVNTFALHVAPDMTRLLVGTYAERGTDQKPATSVCMWQPGPDVKYTKISLQPQEYKPPHSLLATPDWRYGLVGWQNGVLSVIDIKTEHEMYQLSAHHHAIYYLHLLHDQNTLISMSQDHTFKVWDLGLILELAGRGEVKDDLTQLPLDQLWLHRGEQCLNIATIQDYLVSAPANNLNAPRFWSYKDGQIAGELSQTYQDIYTKSLTDHSITFPSRMHGTLTTHGQDVLIYERKRRNGSTVLVTRGFDREARVLAHQRLDVFFRLFITDPVTVGGLRMYGVFDGRLGVYDALTLTLHQDITIPRLSDDITDVNSQGGKKRLLYYNVGVTVDHRYFIIVNPGGGSSGKYMDVVDVQKGEYRGRVALVKHTPFRFLDDGVYYLCEDEGEQLTCYPLALVKSHLATRGRDYDYRRRVHTGNFISQDESIGCCIDNKRHVIKVWKLDSLEDMASLQGHLHTVTSTHISPDNRHLVSASYDNTVRLWDLTTSSQLALFNTYLAVDHVQLSPDMAYIGLESYSAPQRKRGIVLAIKNIEKRAEHSSDGRGDGADNSSLS